MLIDIPRARLVCLAVFFCSAIVSIKDFPIGSDHGRAMGCRPQGVSGSGRNGRSPVESTLTARGSLPGAQGTWDAPLQSVTVTNYSGWLGVRLRPGGLDNMGRSGWGMKLGEDKDGIGCFTATLRVIPLLGSQSTRDCPFQF